MGRRVKKVGPFVFAGTTLQLMFTVPAGKKYELLGTALTAPVGAATNAAGQHTFSGGPVSLPWNEVLNAANANVVSRDGLYELYEAGDSYHVIFAPGGGMGNAYCWFVEVDV